MNWRIIVSFSVIANSAPLVVGHGQETAPETAPSTVPETGVGDRAGLYLGGDCVWEDSPASDPTLVDADNLVRAVGNSAAWIRAVVQQQHIPNDLDARIIGVVDDLKGYDVIRATWETDLFTFRVRQSSRAITMVLLPKNQASGETLGKDELHAFLAETLTTTLRHAKRIIFLTRIEETPFGLKMTRDENCYDENGDPLPNEERRRISRLPQPEQSDVLHRLEHFRVQRLREIDPTLPVEITGGTHMYWWGLAYAATDGRVVVFSAPKSNAGPLVVADCKNWFRKNGEPRRLPRNPRKWSGRGSLWPPKEDYPDPANP